jgi:ornithine cyclodeaminase/alanine dehydrogenase-like protein (mu-crystallin family)
MSADAHATIKLVGYHPENARTRNLPTILSTVSAYDIHTGHLTCLMDGTFLTALRTGAASAVASRSWRGPGRRWWG